MLLHISASLLHTSPESSLGYFPTVILGVVLCLQVAVLYTSDYGYSDRLSQTLAKGITKAGVKTEMVDVLSVDPQVRTDILLCTRSYEHAQLSTCLWAIESATTWCSHLLSLPPLDTKGPGCCEPPLTTH